MCPFELQDMFPAWMQQVLNLHHSRYYIGQKQPLFYDLKSSLLLPHPSTDEKDFDCETWTPSSQFPMQPPILPAGATLPLEAIIYTTQDIKPSPDKTYQILIKVYYGGDDAHECRFQIKIQRGAIRTSINK